MIGCMVNSPSVAWPSRNINASITLTSNSTPRVNRQIRKLNSSKPRVESQTAFPKLKKSQQASAVSLLALIVDSGIICHYQEALKLIGSCVVGYNMDRLFYWSNKGENCGYCPRF